MAFHARVAQVGIAGFTLGGSISYYSPQVGLSCDNVERFGIAIANGSLVTASQTQNQDLFRALKGGGNNFGVLTSVTFRTMPKEDLYGGSIFYDFSSYPLVAVEIHKQISAPTFDQNASIFCAFGAVTAFGKMAYASLKYTKPVQDARLHRNCSILSDATMLEKLPEIWQQSFQQVEHIASLEWIIVTMPFLQSTINAGERAGGNSLGLANSTQDRPLVNVCLYASWDAPEYDEVMENAAKWTIDRISSQAAEPNVAHPYIYMNYAWKDQPVIDGYGIEAKAFLQAVSTKYDPDGLFQKAVPGSFKLFT